jgi:hypothetical protein
MTACFVGLAFELGACTRSDIVATVPSIMLPPFRVSSVRRQTGRAEQEHPADEQCAGAACRRCATSDRPLASGCALG